MTNETTPFDPARIAFGRHVQHDERSRAFAVMIADGYRPQGIEWIRYSPILDQGNLGSCTGNAMAGWLGCSPHVSTPEDALKFDEDYAIRLYSLATRLDEFRGEYPPDDTGSSGLAVAKAARQLGDISRYQHAFSTNGILSALQRGPVIVGTSWTERMFYPDRDGFVRPQGQVLGGHEWLIRGSHLGYSQSDQYFICDNSWGRGFGLDGSFRITLSDWEILRWWQADAIAPIA